MKKKILIIVAVIIALLAIATIFSMNKFEVINPFSSGIGILKILFTDTEYTTVQEKPYIVVFSKVKNSMKNLENYMADTGFYEIEEERYGAVLTYSNGTDKKSVTYKVNANYSSWKIEKLDTSIESEITSVKEEPKNFSAFTYLKYFADESSFAKANNNYSYKKIYDYETYLDYEPNISDMAIEITEESFKDNYAIIILREGSNSGQTNFDSYEIKDGSLFVYLKKDKSITAEMTSIIGLVPKADDTEDVYVERINPDMNMGSYESLKELPEKYLLEEAVQDSCFCVDVKEHINYNDEVLNQFLKNVESKKNGTLRMCNSVDGIITDIYDFEFTGEQFNIAYDESRNTENRIRETNIIYTDEVTETKENSINENCKQITYIFEDEYGNTSSLKKMEVY